MRMHANALRHGKEGRLHESNCTLGRCRREGREGVVNTPRADDFYGQCLVLRLRTSRRGLPPPRSPTCAGYCRATTSNMARLTRPAIRGRRSNRPVATISGRSSMCVCVWGGRGPAANTARHIGLREFAPESDPRGRLIGDTTPPAVGQRYVPHRPVPSL